MVQFYPWFKFYFPLFWGMVISMIVSLTQMKIKFEPRIKLNHNRYIKTLACVLRTLGDSHGLSVTKASSANLKIFCF